MRIIRKRMDPGSYELIDSETDEAVGWVRRVRGSDSPYVGLHWYSVNPGQTYWFPTLNEAVEYAEEHLP